MSHPMNLKKFVRCTLGIVLLGTGLYGCGGDGSTPGGGGTSAPAAPAELTATPLPGPAMHVTWKDNSTDEDSFVLERKVAGGQFNLLTSPTFNEVAHHDADLMPTTVYTYRIAAKNAKGVSAYSSEVSATTASGSGVGGTSGGGGAPAVGGSSVGGTNGGFGGTNGPAGGGSVGAGGGQSGAGGSAAPGAPKFSSQVAPILKTNCALAGCHDAIKKEHGLDYSAAPAEVYGMLVNRIAADHCNGDAAVTRVMPGQPQNSYLMMLLDDIGRCDEVPRMPPSPRLPLTPTELQLIRDWITAGAKND